MTVKAGHYRCTFLSDSLYIGFFNLCWRATTSGTPSESIRVDRAIAPTSVADDTGSERKSRVEVAAIPACLACSVGSLDTYLIFISSPSCRTTGPEQPSFSGSWSSVELGRPKVGQREETVETRRDGGEVFSRLSWSLKDMEAFSQTLHACHICLYIDPSNQPNVVI